jgi:glycosyltransferase involved in cell wall biosynthesis
VAFVFPSLSEGFGFPILESLACACPTACANAASLPEVGGEAPVYFDPLSAESIVAALDGVVASSGDHDRWNAARVRSLRRTWSDVACKFVELYGATA